MLNKGELAQRQSWPLKYKIRHSLDVVEKFLSEFDAYVSIAGVDSYVMNHMLESNGIHLPKASISRAEPFGNNEINAKLHNIQFLRPDMEKKAIIKKYGYPIIYKNLSMAWNRWYVGDEEQKHYRLHGRINEKTGKHENEGTIPQKYYNLIYAPFHLTERCCVIIKEQPLIRFANQNNIWPITGEKAADSGNRRQNYLKNGCIIYNEHFNKCTPLGPWTEKDIMEYIIKYNVTISSEYGKIVEDKSQMMLEKDMYPLKFEKADRTGCDICTFGIAKDKDRFLRMKKKNYLLYSAMLKGGEFIHTGVFRPIIFTPNKQPEMSDLKWVPTNEGYGYKYVIDWLNGMFGLGIRY